MKVTIHTVVMYKRAGSTLNGTLGYVIYQCESVMVKGVGQD